MQEMQKIWIRSLHKESDTTERLSLSLCSVWAHQVLPTFSRLTRVQAAVNSRFLSSSTLCRPHLAHQAVSVWSHHFPPQNHPGASAVPGIKHKAFLYVILRPMSSGHSPTSPGVSTTCPLIRLQPQGPHPADALHSSHPRALVTVPPAENILPTGSTTWLLPSQHQISPS